VKRIHKRLTYANVMSSIAVFLVLGGATAVAAKKIGSNEIKGNSITTGKIKKEAVTKAKVKQAAIDSSKLADQAVTTAKLANTAVESGKIANGAVTSAKIAGGAVSSAQLAPGERSEVISSSTSSGFDFVDTYNPATWTTVMSLNLPEGNWVVTANIGIAIGTGPVHVGCRLNQGGKVLAQSGTEGDDLGIIPSIDGVDLAAVAAGGQVTVTCGDSASGTEAINRSLIAQRAGSVAAG
jgi:hypothetical protein